MLIRVLVKNFLSFNEPVEFNLLPNNKRKRHEEHVYECSSLNLLKVAAIYGNNAAGKTNLLKAVNLAKFVASSKELFSKNNIYSDNVFRLSKSINPDIPISIALEFISNDRFFYYHIDILSNNVVNEQLSYKKNLDEIYSKLFTSKYLSDNRTLIVYDDLGNEINNYIDDKLQVYFNKNSKASIISLQEDYPVIQNEVIEDVLKWFNDSLMIIDTEELLKNIIPVLNKDEGSQNYINQVLPTLSLGVSNISLSTRPLSEILDSEDEKDQAELIEILNNMPDKVAGISKIQNHKTPLLSILKEDGEVIVRQLVFTHSGADGEDIEMTINNQSDGTKSSIIIMYILNKLINHNSIVFVDEIENSMHPMIIRDLLEIFLKDKKSKGQLVYTTHESHLLDQELLRADEIWFAQKDNGSTRLYSLNDFKEHSAIDVQKGYFAGRYGAIPYLNSRESLLCKED